ncbi:ABC transporter substrate-binding protein [Marinomonas mediterranea]|jgi:ABC-type Fe3+-hydroxamate transport system, periplasmic component|uniref:ABC-type transporter, periplasmic subunit n=1 Tax=Marinomonas mediterranea (strain ATCC 700492 / JCM 21426 / NBRC 103028 / MMB-1) TaxID=717774 RepID=F2K3S0_MARM1|nr:ABC transporter substrate-binding protein [Marinomonas mediterranea]ADZ90169.1 ABC-type transporter, periplasmic subunit [Marinomonas mediterranea MMB-1]WCN08232.1 ABC transporter substrate-binding protein [Marinomonas mediterranea]WCN16370.1 ABC transporter substrate-binding protein [Marinomonas mediterranea MMB-1]
MELKHVSRFFATSMVVFSAHTQAATDYPVTIENCGYTHVYEQAPSSAVTIGQAATEILYSLGLASAVKGTSVWFSDVLPEYADANVDIPRLADNDPSFEAVLSKRPELVAIQYEWHVGAQGVVATREQFHDMGVSTYNLPMDCDNKDNTTGLDGTRLDQFSISSLYKSISQLSTIFNVPEQGENLIASLTTREQKAAERAEKAGVDGRSAVFWFSSAAMDIDPYVAGQKGAPGYIMKTLGIENIVQSNEEWPTVGWETIAKANPDIIVIAKMKRRRFPADDFQKKLEFLRTDPVTKEMKAVKNGNIVIIDAQEMDTTIRVITGLERLTQAVEDLN